MATTALGTGGAGGCEQVRGAYSGDFPLAWPAWPCGNFNASGGLPHMKGLAVGSVALKQGRRASMQLAPLVSGAPANQQSAVCGARPLLLRLHVPLS